MINHSNQSIIRFQILQVEEMMQAIHQAFIDSLPTLDWMEDSTKANDRVKALKVNDKIGWPDWLLDPKELDEHLKEVGVLEVFLQTETCLLLVTSIRSCSLHYEGHSRTRVFPGGQVPYPEG